MGHDDASGVFAFDVLAGDIGKAEAGGDFEELGEGHAAIRRGAGVDEVDGDLFALAGVADGGAAGLPGGGGAAEGVDEHFVHVAAGGGELETHDGIVRAADGTELHGFAAVDDVGGVGEGGVAPAVFRIDVGRIRVPEAGGDGTGFLLGKALVAFALAMEGVDIDEGSEAAGELLELELPVVGVDGRETVRDERVVSHGGGVVVVLECGGGPRFACHSRVSRNGVASPAGPGRFTGVHGGVSLIDSGGRMRPGWGALLP